MQAALAATRQEAMRDGEADKPQTEEEILAEVLARFPTAGDMIKFHLKEAGGEKKKLIKILRQ